ncbi:transcriptional regulator [Virgibacillus sp. 7505]|uniref:ArsR/SmtB family transcription factor n=1 Tax=Virgibacillus sp. 7505 TaxID=2022548 RepID=UPI000BA73036|nr:ArsR family transcriptional regulator [Virgibacillus sp. 7505]PAE17726.1 transcriptional regulator [Virgibacillus sp. 7505]
MQLDLSQKSLNVYECLASETRLKILELLSVEDLNISQLAAKLEISNAIVTRHIQKLEQAQLVTSSKAIGKSGQQKIIQLNVDNIEIKLPKKIYSKFENRMTHLKLGHYTDYSVQPTCGLASTEKIIGRLDDPKYFMDGERMDASLLWLSSGYVVYKVPNLLKKSEKPEMLEISLEIASEFPGSNNVWPSDISFYINNIKVGTWTCPGNFSDVRGFYTPNWWEDTNSQYGLLKHLRINHGSTHIDGEFLSDVTIEDLGLESHHLIEIKLAVEPDAKHVGGLTLFGQGFGNHDQDINVNLYYS